MAIKAKPAFSLKDQLFNKSSVTQFASNLAAVYPGFEPKKFTRATLKKFPELELKERIRWLVTQLGKYLPANFHDAQKILLQALPEPLDPSLKDDDFGKFIWVVPGEYVAKHGCQKETLALSLNFLREATKRFSSESAIRPFLNKFPEQTLLFMHECAQDDNYHVRRWASEGIRPFLPWAERVRLPEQSVVAVLDRLHTDNTRFVTRSVANTLNDISRLDAQLVIRTLRRWQKIAQQQPAELRWMTRHALRTLLKEDHHQALAMFGYPLQPKFRISDLLTTDQVKVGNDFVWSGKLTSASKQLLKITLRIHFLKANGSYSKKVFAVIQGDFNQGESVIIRKRLSFKPITTRVMYPGTHYAELLVNGVSRGKRSFELVV